ncbi:pleiotropic drug resistance protein 3-like [Gossypium australe]|uniref:Pleiotropic drug resistance protein 3-like n=1 Tax=Gossypium australe TaxID=47621 RepID=A0A5B6WEN8_9ROSI|nr:pleiotropic drug resistance protein 3-like [Gossypium australe]
MDSRVVEKMITTLPIRYESKISSLEESRDFSTILLFEVINALYAQEQRRVSREEGHVEGAFQDKNKEGSIFSSNEEMKDCIEKKNRRVEETVERKIIHYTRIAKKWVILRECVGSSLMLNVEIASHKNASSSKYKPVSRQRCKLVDTLTKALGKMKFEKLHYNIGVCNMEAKEECCEVAIHALANLVCTTASSYKTASSLKVASSPYLRAYQNYELIKCESSTKL